MDNLDNMPSMFGIYGGFMEYSFFLPPEDLDTLRAEGKLEDYMDAMLELDKEFPTPQSAPRKGEEEFSALIWRTFGT
jgi:hypothetical protein